MNENSLPILVNRAINADDIGKLQELFGEDSSLLHLVRSDGSWLHTAARRGKLGIVKFLVASGIDVNRRGGLSEGTATDSAAGEGHVEIVRYLLDHGAEMDTSESTSNPLIAAVIEGHKDVVRLLLDRGIDASVTYPGDDEQDMDAIAFAKENGQTEIAEMIRAHLARSK